MLEPLQKAGSGVSQKTLDELKEAWPGRITLRADEVALVLRGKQTRRVVERVRNKMKDGTYGTGARKVDGVWQLPLTDLAEVIEPTPVATALPIESAPKPTTRRRARIGPRVTFITQTRFWASVLKAMGETNDAENLATKAEEVLEELRREDRETKARVLKKMIMGSLGDVGGKPTKGRGPL